MQNIEKIDKNFKVNTKINKDDIVFCSVMQEPFSVHGLLYENGQFLRMPKAAAEKVSEGVNGLNPKCAGGRVRFKTDSAYIAISAKMHQLGKMAHFAYTGSMGFDMYTDEGEGIKFFGTFVPSGNITEGYDSVLDFKDRRMREITINFPLYSGVTQLHVGLQQDAAVMPAAPYSNKKPFVYYGSSITQGACASRPGNAYSAILSRRFNVDYINLGFSGSGQGEPSMAEYIAGLDMDLFVMDYDHNAPNPEHLQNTHEKMFKTVRAAHPNIPIILMTATSLDRFTGYMNAVRRDIIYQTYSNAKQNGDENVYFWDGTKEFAPYADYGTVEGLHPNDCGFWGIAKSLGDLMEKII